MSAYSTSGMDVYVIAMVNDIFVTPTLYPCVHYLVSSKSSFSHSSAALLLGFFFAGNINDSRDE